MVVKAEATYTNLVDGKVLTSYKAELNRVNWFTTCQNQPMPTIFVVSSLPEGVKARVQVRTLKDGQRGRLNLGDTSSLQTAIRNEVILF